MEVYVLIVDNEDDTYVQGVFTTLEVARREIYRHYADIFELTEAELDTLDDDGLFDLRIYWIEKAELQA